MFTLEVSPTLHVYFAHLDVNLYESYKECLEFFYGRMVPGGIVLFDGYNDPSWPGCNKAVNEFLVDKPEWLEMIECDKSLNRILPARVGSGKLLA